MSWVKRNRKLLFKPLAAVMLLLGSHSVSNAQVWGPMGVGVKGDPVAYAVEQNRLVMAVDHGLNQHGRVFTLNFWTGVFWTQIGVFQTDSAGKVNKMTYYAGKLYIAGQFHNVRNLNGARNIIAWNIVTQKFERVAGLDATIKDFVRINDMVVFDKKLVVGGLFVRSNTVESRGLQTFDALQQKWINLSASMIGKGFDGEVNDLLVQDDTLWVAGNFEKVNEKKSKYVFQYYKGSAKFYISNFIKPYRLGVYQKKLFCATENGSNSYLYFMGPSGFSKKFSLPTVIHNIQDIVEFDGKLWMTGTFTVKIKGKDEKITLVRFNGDVWEPAPGYEENYTMDFFMSTDKELYGAGKKFISTSPRIWKTGRFYPDRGIVYGKIYHDRDKNCRITNGDGFLSDRMVRATPGRFATRPDAFGNYTLFLPHGNYTVEVVQPQYWEVTPCADEKRKVELDDEMIRQKEDFPLKFKTEITDVKVNLTSLSGWQARKGGTQRYNLQTVNLGSEKIRNGKIELKFNTEVNQSFVSFPKPDTIDDNRVVYLVSSIESGQQLNIPFWMELPGTFSEDNLDIIASMAPSKNETSTDDNESQLTQLITDSTYENFKQVFPLPAEGETISKVDPDDGELQYLINFANFSTDTVHTLHVIDTIDANLDIQYIQETGASHNYTTQVVNGPPGSNIATLIWTFNDLDLVPNPSRYNDMPGYAGYIGFKVKLNSTVTLGTKITNQANIVFDYTHSEMTNLVETEVAEVISTGPSIDLGGVAVNLYPNPSEGNVTIEAKEDGMLLNAEEILVLDAQGREVNVNVQGQGSVLHIDFTSQASGLYLIKGNSNKGIYKKTLILQ